MNKILAIAGVVIKELYRRKDFYVLFVLTALITLLLGSVNFFHDDRIARYLKEICLLLIWISALIIAITTTARSRAPRSSPENFSAAGWPSACLWRFFTCSSASSAARASTHGRS